MSIPVYTLDFKGYYTKSADLPDYSGIYCVYACKDIKTNPIRKLLYIGESGNIYGRVSNHERRDDWEKELKSGEVLCFNAAKFRLGIWRKHAEAVMIFRHEPPCNTEYVHHFPYKEAVVKTKGKNRYLKSILYAHPTTIGIRSK